MDKWTGQIAQNARALVEREFTYERAVGRWREILEEICEISRETVSCAIEVRQTPGGPGLLERVYEEALAWELAQQGMKVDRQVSLPIHYNLPLVHMGRVVRATREASGPFGFGCIV